MVDHPWQQDFGRGVHALDVFSTNSANFHVVFVVVTFSPFFFPWFSRSYSFSQWWLGRFFLWVEIVSESRLVKTSFARQPHGASISASLSRPRATLPLARELDFRCSQCSSPTKMGLTVPSPAWCPWKKAELEGCLQTGSSIHRPTRKLAQSKFLNARIE